jgi:hypothetical protein
MYVMQIKMMQKIGIEQCQVESADLTEENLRRPRAQFSFCNAALFF